MAWPMVARVLDTCYAELFHAEGLCRTGGDGVGGLREPVGGADGTYYGRDYPDLTLFSLPAFADGERRRSIELWRQRHC